MAEGRRSSTRPKSRAPAPAPPKATTPAPTPQHPSPPTKLATAHRRAAAGDTFSPAALSPHTASLASGSSELRDAARRVLALTEGLMAGLDHIPGCPAGAGGRCTCGRETLVTALGELRAALEPA